MPQSYLPYDEETTLFLLARQPPPSCTTTFSLPIAEICARGKVSRAHLIASVGRQSEVHNWRITVDIPTDRILYERTARSVKEPIIRIPYPKASSPASQAPQVIDPQIVGMKARQYQESELKAGREISTTDAVAHVMAKRA